MHDSTDTPDLSALPPALWAVRSASTLRAHLTAAAWLHRQGIAPKAAGEEVPTESSVEIISLSGMITPRGGLLAMLFGLDSGLEAFRSRLRSAVADPGVSSIVLAVDSPGGLIDLVPETANEIAAANAVKPVTAVASTEAASAAYWLASQAGELVVTPSGSVGSIGVFVLHADESRAYEQAGIKPTLIKAGEYKADPNRLEPLSDSGREYLQGTVDEIYSMFVGAVASGRGVSEEEVREGFGQGRMALAAEAVELGMADRVATLEEVVAELVGGGGGGAAAARAVRAEGSEQQPEVTNVTSLDGEVVAEAVARESAEGDEPAAEGDDAEAEQDAAAGEDDAPAAEATEPEHKPLSEAERRRWLEVALG